jgi:hypothetical protein
VIEETFVKVLMLAREQKQLRRVGTVAIDGSKILANASKHAAVSYERAGEQIEFMEEEVRRLMAKAEEADTRPLEEGLSLPEEIRRREDRKARLLQARDIIEKRFQAHQREKESARERREDDEPERKRRGRKRKATPDGTMQYNFTDPDSRIMKAGNGEHFEQAYNAQAAVDTSSMLIVGARVSQKPNDKQELEPTLGSIDCGVMKAKKVLVDSGFYSEEAIGRVEAEGQVEVLAAVEKSHHGMTVDDLEKKLETREPAADAPMKEKMRHRLCSKRGRALYKLRKETVEPVFGIIKQAMGFRRFSLRGKPKAEMEWILVCLAYNMRRLFNLLCAAGDWRSGMGLSAVKC